jgi:hypothetical protein
LAQGLEFYNIQNTACAEGYHDRRLYFSFQSHTWDWGYYVLLGFFCIPAVKENLDLQEINVPYDGYYNVPECGIDTLLYNDEELWV